MRKSTYDGKNDELFSLLPQDVILQAVDQAYDNLRHTVFGNLNIQDVQLSSHVHCTILHELIVTEIASLPGWRAGRQKVEPDIIHESGIGLQVKTRSEPDGIAGNRHSCKSAYSDPSEYYLCVNFIPNDCVCRVRAGWVESSWWKSQKGKGNAAYIKSDKLRLVPMLYGDYINKLNLIALEGFGSLTVLKLQDRNIHSIGDFKRKRAFETAESILNKTQLSKVKQLLSYI